MPSPTRYLTAARTGSYIAVRGYNSNDTRVLDAGTGRVRQTHTHAHTGTYAQANKLDLSPTSFNRGKNTDRDILTFLDLHPFLQSVALASRSPVKLVVCLVLLAN